MAFREKLAAVWNGLSEEQVSRLHDYRQILQDENKNQNLTRIGFGDDEFITGHLEDVRGLLESKLLKYPALDFGSGGGIPGLIAAIIDQKDWTLCESETKKGEFLKRAVLHLGLKNVAVFIGRAQVFLSQNRVNSVVCRAVGKTWSILKEIEKCSTWNNLVLLKGPSWPEEAKLFEEKFSKHCGINACYCYQLGPGFGDRYIVSIENVLRGTK